MIRLDQGYNPEIAGCSLSVVQGSSEAFDCYPRGLLLLPIQLPRNQAGDALCVKRGNLHLLPLLEAGDLQKRA